MSTYDDAGSGGLALVGDAVEEFVFDDSALATIVLSSGVTDPDLTYDDEMAGTIHFGGCLRAPYQRTFFPPFP